MPVYTEDEFLRDLDTLTVPQGNLRLMVYRPDDDHDYGIRWDDLNPAAAQADFSWGPDIEYNENDIVTFEDEIWISQQNANIGVVPGTDVAFWVIGVKSKSGLVPWAAGIFTETNVSVYYDDGGGTLIYRLINPTRPYNSVDIASEIILGDWEPVGAPAPPPAPGWPLSGTEALTGDVIITGGQNRSVRLGSNTNELDSFDIEVSSGLGSKSTLNMTPTNASFGIFDGDNMDVLINGFDNSISLRLAYNSGANFSRLVLREDYAEIVSNNSVFEGLKYGSDFSANYTGRSLPDVDWVQSEISAITGGLQMIRYVIPSIMVLNGNTAPIELLPAPGADLYYGIEGAFISMDYVSTPYATNTNTFIRIGTTAISGGAITINNTADKAAAYPMTVTNSIPINQNVNFFVQSGNPTAGDSDIVVTLFYRILSI